MNSNVASVTCAQPQGPSAVPEGCLAGGGGGGTKPPTTERQAESIAAGPRADFLSRAVRPMTRHAVYRFKRASMASFMRSAAPPRREWSLEEAALFAARKEFELLKLLSTDKKAPEWWKRPFFCYLGSLIDVGPKKQNWVYHTLLAVKTRSEEKFRGFHTLLAVKMRCEEKNSGFR